MKRTNIILGIAAAVGMMLAAAPSVTWAESASRTGAAEDFLSEPDPTDPLAPPIPIKCPDPEISTDPCFDPNAPGTKFSGTLTIVFHVVGDTACTTNLRVTNAYYSLTLRQGNSSVPFATEYLAGVRPHPEHVTNGFCMGSNDPEVVKVIVDLVSLKTIPIICPACTSFKVKSITNFLYTQGEVLSSFGSKGLSADIVIAVR